MAMQILFLIFFLCTRLPTNLCESDYNLSFERVEAIRGDEVTEADYSGLVLRRARHISNGREYFLNGTYTFTRDFTDTDMCSVDIKRSDSEDSEYGPAPYNIRDYSAPDFFNTVYETFAQPMFDGKTDFPTIPPDGLYYVPEGTYYVKEARAKDLQDTLPDDLEPGWYKVTTYFRNDQSQIVGGLRIIFQVEPKN